MKNSNNGFVNCNEVIVNDYILGLNGCLNIAPRLATEKEKLEYWRKMIQSGFIPQETKNLFLRENCGAYMGNLNVKPSNDPNEIKSCILQGLYDKYWQYGYKITFGPPAPDETQDLSNKIGVYCSNFEEILKQTKTK